jgi:hypothetical protein
MGRACSPKPPSARGIGSKAEWPCCDFALQIAHDANLNTGSSHRLFGAFFKGAHRCSHRFAQPLVVHIH